MLEWNVYMEDANSRSVKTHNVFNNIYVWERCKKAAKKFKDDKEAFAEEVLGALMYMYWSRCEFEIVLQSWPPDPKFKACKIDIYDQVVLNKERFIDYAWEHRKEIR